MLLPVGISFYTFKAASYIIDIYRGNTNAEKNLITYALYVSFFPQLLAGPIERSSNLLPQFKLLHNFDYNRTTSGLRLILWGLFKKVVIADRLAVVVNRIFDNPHEYSGIPLIVASFFFTYQIYCDFSGYSDIAIGTAKVLGFKSKQNFNLPYFSKSIAEFWRRWHISLTSWFRDYLYFPLGGNKVKKTRWYTNLVIVFLVSGLWHGANWTFVIWGGLHAAYYLLAIWTQNLRAKLAEFLKITKIPALHNLFQIIVTFALVCFAWIFFRANTITDAFYISTHLFEGTGHFLLNITDSANLRSILGQLGLERSELIIAFCSIAILETVQFFLKDLNAEKIFLSKPTWLRWIGYYILVSLILFCGAFNTSQNFIYLQF